MATTTTNFNFPIPQSTDLVKDGATAIAALGTSVDTQFVDLKGGTTGQVLAKASNTDLDYSWTTPQVGDITAVTAGTGISGGGTGGDVTITNSMATAIDAKGDLVAGTGADAFARLAVGNNGETLVADSTASTGLKWAKSSNFVGCSLFSTSTTSAGNSTYTAVLFNSESFDTDGFHSTSVNTSRITIPAGLGGKYLVNAFGEWDNNASGYRGLNFYLNGTRIRNHYLTASAIFPTQQLSCVLNLAAGDYIEVYVSQDSGSSRTFYVPSSDGAFEVTYLGA